MTKPGHSVHPYVPNAAEPVKAAMLAEIGAASIDELYADVPESIRLRRLLDLPAPLRSEAELVRHMQGLLAKNRPASEYLSFLGAGCAAHHVPAVCDEINSRGEFLTTYSGRAYEEHGRYQALFEYQSMMGELLEMDAVNVPTYDSYQAAATGLRMTTRITGRARVLISSRISADMRTKLEDYLRAGVEIGWIEHDPQTGLIDLDQLDRLLDESVAGVFLENPSYLGLIEWRAEEIGRLVHASGALLVVGVDPISLGVLRAPGSYGADIATGDLQPLGIHPQYGGGLGGFIASSDAQRFVQEYPSRLYGLAPTSEASEYGFGEILFEERTHFGQREQAREWTGTAAALWAVTAGVYLALMGPQGMAEIGDGIMARSRYAMERLAQVPGVQLPFRGRHHFKEFVVAFGPGGPSVGEVNRRLLDRGIMGGKDLGSDFPDLGKAALWCVTENHTQADIDHLVATLAEVLR